MTAIAQGVVTYTLNDGSQVWTGNAYDGNGTFWIVDSEEGWTDGASVRLDTESRAAADGLADEGHRYGGRLIALRGRAHFTSLEQVRAAQRSLTSLLAHGSRAATLTVSDGYVTTLARVRLAGEPQTRLLSPLMLEWRIELLAPDPLKYGPEQIASTGLPSRGSATGIVYPLAYPLDYGVTTGASAGELLLGNPGRVAYHPRLRIDGPVTNPRIWLVETGAEVRLNMTVPVDQHVDLLLKGRRVLLQGVASRRFAVTYSGDWLAVPPGGGTLRWEADSYDDRAQLWCWAPDGAWL